MKRYLVFIERVAIAMSAIGIAMAYFEVGQTYNSVLIIWGLSTMAIAYFLTFYSLDKTEISDKELFVWRLLTRGMFFACIGILFKIESWPFAKIMSIGGGSIAIVSSLVIIYFRKDLPKDQELQSILTKGIFIGLTSIVFTLMQVI